MKYYLLLLLSIAVNTLFAQVVGGVQSKGMDMMAQPYGFVTEIKADTKEVKGDVYLHSEWCTGTIEFINGSKLEHKNIRYNIDVDFFEVSIDGITKGSNGANVQKFELHNNLSLEKYVSAKSFLFNNTRLIGFLRELVVGTHSLYARTEVKLVPGSYVKALDMGNEDDEYSKRVTYYMASGKELQEIETNKKKFASGFTDRESEILEYIKENGLSLKKETDLIQIFKFVNNAGN